MRKSIIFIIAAAALCAACVKSETDGSNVISFSPVASKATKAIINGTTYPTDESFVVSAYHNGTAPYFEDLTASYQSSIALWETSTSQYWPLGGSLTFNAYSPASAGLTIDASGVMATDYEVRTSAQMTTDLLYATATVADCSAYPASVPLNFSHALAQRVFKVKAADYYNTSGSTISLAMTSLSLSGIYSVADFADGAWDNHESAQTFALSSTSTPLTYDANDDPETIDLCAYLFLPQEISADARINVGYSITQNISGTTYSLENPPVAVALRNTVTEWEPGKKYIYTISIGLDNLITFTASATDWTTQEGGVVVE